MFLLKHYPPNKENTPNFKTNMTWLSSNFLCLFYSYQAILPCVPLHFKVICELDKLSLLLFMPRCTYHCLDILQLPSRDTTVSPDDTVYGVVVLILLNLNFQVKVPE